MDRVKTFSFVKKIWDAKTYEPLLLLHTIAHFSTKAISDSLRVDKSCLVTLNKPDEVCDDLSSNPDDEIEVQQSASKLQGFAILAGNLIPILLLFYIGPLSDRYGRKPFLFIVLVSKTISLTVYLITSIFMRSSAVFTIVAPFIYSLGSGMSGFQMLIFACIADITTEENRTFRLGVLKIFMAFGGPLGNLIGGQLYAAGGYVATFGVGVVLLLLCIVNLFLSEETASRENRVDGKISISWLLSIPVELAVAVFRKDGPRRGIVLFNLLIHITLFIGKDPQYFLFFKLMLGWDATDFSNWLFYKELLKAFGFVLMMPILVRWLGVPDAGLGMLGAASPLFMELAHSQIVSPSRGWIIWLSPFLDILELLSPLSARTIISKCSDGKNELGKLFAAQAILDALAFALSGPMYGWIYSSTVGTLPVTQFLVAAGFLFLALIATRLSDIFIQRKEIQQQKINTGS